MPTTARPSRRTPERARPMLPTPRKLSACLSGLCLALLVGPLAAQAQTLAERYADLIANRGSLDDSQRLAELFDLQWEYELAEYPTTATYIGVAGYNDRWTDRSLDAIERRKAALARPVAVLDDIDRAQLSPAEQLDYDLFARTSRRELEGARFPAEYLPIDQFDGAHLALPQVFAVAPTSTRQDYEDMIARLEAVPEVVDEWLVLMRLGLDAGITQPAVVLRDVPQQVVDLMISDLGQNPFYAPFLAMPETINPDVAASLRQRAQTALTEMVIPAYGRLRDFLTETYLPGARNDIAFGSLPDGEAWYRYLVEGYTTTQLTPREIHELGLAEVARIRAEMSRTIDMAGFGDDFEGFVEFLRTDDRFYHETAEDLLIGYRDIAKRIDPALMRLFGKLPRMTYGVEPTPDYNAPSDATARYLSGSTEAGRAGTFFANTYNLRSRPIWEMEALTLHEAVPGHHLQLALQQEIEGLPEFRRYGGYTVFIEGWGLYAESLGEELGLYRDPYSKFGQLTYEIWRAIRLVVDTGMHSMGWTRDEAIAYFMENTSKPEHDVTVEIDRYIVMPGQALAYKLGELKFKELRAAAREALGDAFDIRAFHDVLLAEGALPLDVLDARMREWLDAQQR